MPVSGRDVWRAQRQALMNRRLAALIGLSPMARGEQPRGRPGARNVPGTLPTDTTNGGNPLIGFALDQLSSINQSIASGITRVSYDGKTTEYRSLDELIRIRDMLLAALGMTSPGPTVLAVHDRGYGSPGDWYGGGWPIEPSNYEIYIQDP